MKQNETLKKYARELRQNMTQEERRLWYQFLKDLPQTVHRQKIIGSYIVDFYVASVRLVIEIDGSQHYQDEAKRQDEKRDSFLTHQGLTVRRYSNYDINQNFAGVCQDILNHIEKSPHPSADADTFSPRRR